MREVDMTRQPEQGQPEHRLSISTPDFQPMTAEEASQIRGGGWGAGTCVGIGYSCKNKGGIGVGVCAIVGYGTGAERVG
ncbi:MAG: hypothetical protein Q8O40_13395 [Chloroflexota bacterium]|nr:hypothetical protein [Chloroflexota bacterium]